MEPDPPSSLIGLRLSLIIGTLLGDLESLNLGSLGPGLGDRGPELMRLRSASRDGDGDLDLGGELPPSAPQQASSGGMCVIGENSPLLNLSWSALLLSDVWSAISLPLASRTSGPFGTGDTECQPLFLDVGLPLPAFSSVGLLFLGTSAGPRSPHPYSFNFAEASV